MNKSKIFIRTGLGNALLAVQYGKISGDARRVLALIDGSASLGMIFEKVPHSVRIHLNDIFSYLLSGGMIEEQVVAAGHIAVEASGNTGQEKPQQAALPGQASEKSTRVEESVEKESKRRIELEHELAEMLSQLEATKARQQEVEAVCQKLEQQVVDFEQERHKKSTKNLRTSPAQAEVEIDLHESLNDFSLLNQTLLDQQNNLDGTLKLRNYQMQLKSERNQNTVEIVDEKLALSNPHYKKLRALDFFKGFANSELLHFIGFVKWQKVPAGEIIFKEGEVGLSFYIIVAGCVDIIRKGRVLAYLGWGDFFGEFAHLSEVGPLRSAQVVAATDCELLVVEPMDVELSSVQMRLNVVEALLRGQVKRAMVSSQRIDSLTSHLNITSSDE